MPETSFQIEFAYNDALYLGSVMPLGTSPASGFSVLLENDNGEFFLEIFLNPSTSPLEEWKYECGVGEKAAHYYDKALLDEIGEQIQANLEKHTAANY